MASFWLRRSQVSYEIGTAATGRGLSHRSPSPLIDADVAFAVERARKSNIGFLLLESHQYVLVAHDSRA